MSAAHYVTVHLPAMLDVALTSLVGIMLRLVAKGVKADFEVHKAVVNNKLDTIHSNQADQDMKLDQHSSSLHTSSLALAQLLGRQQVTEERLTHAEAEAQATNASLQDLSRATSRLQGILEHRGVT